MHDCRNNESFRLTTNLAASVKPRTQDTRASAKKALPLVCIQQTLSMRQKLN